MANSIRTHILILAIMEYAYDSARRCGETATEAERQGFEARDWARRMMGLE